MLMHLIKALQDESFPVHFTKAAAELQHTPEIIACHDSSTAQEMETQPHDPTFQLIHVGMKIPS